MNPNKLVYLILLFLSSWSLNAQTQKQIDNLYTFAKLYGYIRYFHPSDEAQQIDWEKFAVLGCREVEKCRSPQELKNTLYELFQPIAPTLIIFNSKENINFEVSEITPLDSTGYKPIYWQHQGFNSGFMPKLNKSLRVNRPIHTKEFHPLFKTYGLGINNDSIAGKEFRFRAKMKRLNGACNSFLILRSGEIFETTEDLSVSDTVWQERTIEGTFNSFTNRLYTGIVFKGEGQLLIDDIEVQIKSNDKWEVFYKNGFNKNEASKNSWKATGNLRTTIIDNSCLLETFDSVKYSTPNQIFDKQIQIGEYIEKEIGYGLRCIVPLALYGNENSTYPLSNPEKLSHLSLRLKNISEDSMRAENLYLRLADIVILYNIFQHFNPYLPYLYEKAWNENVTNAIANAYQSITLIDFKKNIEMFLNHFHDSHVRVWSIDDYKEGYHLPPIACEWINDKLIITHVFSDSIILRVGDEIKRINNTDAKLYYKDVEKYISGSDDWINYMAKINAFRGHVDSTTIIEAISNSKNIRVELNRNIGISDYEKLIQPNKSSQELSDGIWYVNMRELQSKDNSIIESIKYSKSLIIDARGYFLDKQKLHTHLFKKKISGHPLSINYNQILYPDGEEIRLKKVSLIKQSNRFKHIPQKPFIKARVFVIIDGSACSAPETFISNLRYCNNEITIIGQPTAGATGAKNMYTLPGGLQIQWTGPLTIFSDGSQFHAKGNMPDILVEKTIEDVLQGKDPYIEKALEIINQ
ncbi:hypothetical protein J1N10_20560 [Carboxylicivirga sp. A043]|uniref:S41 family peptidase n=1 Tax=Carboxylicivirga litoralis TaxID=2816963 RepID=UPI0021CB4EE6|nr:S41 family peptidase [Carboxylicivirga sp. A043]MCU4158376.1 hypothetical protein [Carboxylicivirga sp. A043]